MGRSETVFFWFLVLFVLLNLLDAGSTYLLFEGYGSVRIYEANPLFSKLFEEVGFFVSFLIKMFVVLLVCLADVWVYLRRRGFGFGVVIIQNVILLLVVLNNVLLLF